MELVFPTRTSGSFTVGITTSSLKLSTSFNQSRPFPFCSNVIRTDKNTSITTSISPHIAASYQPQYSAVSTPNNDPLYSSTKCNRWIVVMETPPGSVSSKSEIVNYYVDTLARVLGSEKEAQMCIYDASWQTHFGFCCEIDEEASRQLASVPGVLSVRPDKDEGSSRKDFSFTSSLSSSHSTSSGYSSKIIPPVPGQNSIYWLVRMEKPKVEVVTKAQVVDYYVQTLTKVLGNEKDAQMSIYNISWEEVFGFCCHIDQECAEELAAIPGVLSVRPDSNINSENKDYKGLGIFSTSAEFAAPETNQAPKTKRLFVTGLSFYTSEKTLRAAFEGFGELVEVKIIMDKISKRSKGYAFIEYTTEEAAGAALKEMNGKIINGWMIVVDVAKTYPPRNNRGRSQVSTQSTY